MWKVTQKISDVWAWIVTLIHIIYLYLYVYIIIILEYYKRIFPVFRWWGRGRSGVMNTLSSGGGTGGSSQRRKGKYQTSVEVGPFAEDSAEHRELSFENNQSLVRDIFFVSFPVSWLWNVILLCWNFAQVSLPVSSDIRYQQSAIGIM